MSDTNSVGQDEVFKQEINRVSDFKFGTQVVNVFDDMVSRSVPYYGEIQRMMAELSADHAQPGTNIYDLGCSTGATFTALNGFIPQDVGFVGIDDSEEMINKCDLKLKAMNMERPYELIVGDIHQNLVINNASVVILSLTLQFVRPLYRQQLLKNIYQGLNQGGVLILIEKVLTENSLFNRDFIKHYYNYKRRNGYSDLEISQKREALENVLIPYKLSENVTLLEDSGFRHCEVFFKWYNFSGLIATKQ